MKKRKICVVTGSRAEYGLLRGVIDEINKSPKISLQIVATGMHLSPEFGLTYQEIEEDGFKINRKVEMLLSGDSSTSISKSTGLGMIGFSDAFKELNPDIIIVLGDRYEILSASLTALFENIPIAHISGGESTEGAFDEAIRHSITKMAWWHFVSTNEYKKRVIQLGEDPSRIFNVGGLGVDAIKRLKLLSKKELSKKLGIKFGKRNLLITYHPVTLEKHNSINKFQNLLDVLHDLNDTYLIFTMPNADTDGRAIKNMINEFVKSHPLNTISFQSMGSLNYLSTIQYVDGVVGNSSSGIAEVPTFKIGTINIGDRQKGRIKASSVIDCTTEKDSIRKSIDRLFSKEFQDQLKYIENPYGNGNAAEKILDILEKSSIPLETKKAFYDL